MRKIGPLAGGIMLFLLFMMLMSSGSGDGSPTETSGGQTPQGVLPQQGVENIPPSEQWVLTQFDNLAIEFDGQLFDKGTFQNQATGEVVVARCVTMEVPDPNVGDIYTRNGDTFNPVGGGSQTFQTFEVVTIPLATPVVVVTSTLPVENLPESVLPAQQTPEEPSGITWKGVGNFFLVYLCLVALIFGLVFFLMLRKAHTG